MNRIQKSKTKAIIIPQYPQFLKVNKKEISNVPGIPHKITQKKIKLNPNLRQFGKDITISLINSSKGQSEKLQANSITTNKVIYIYKYNI